MPRAPSSLFAHVHSPLRLCPDGKVLVVLEENGSGPTRWRLHAVVVRREASGDACRLVVGAT